MSQDDYPAWTLYSGGNPRSYRRIYCGRLLYAIPADDYMTSQRYTWNDANAEPFAVHGPYASCEEAQRAAEAYAEEAKHVAS
jgi:hypothetical protein